MNDRSTAGAFAQDDLSSQVAACLPKASGLYWGGKWHEPAAAARQTSINPSTGKPLRDVVCGGPDEAAAAVRAAGEARRGWAATPPLERAACLREVARRVLAHADELALIDAADCGNP